MLMGQVISSFILNMGEMRSTDIPAVNRKAVTSSVITLILTFPDKQGLTHESEIQSSVAVSLEC